MPLFLLGLLSKETAVVFPGLIIACLYLTSPQRLNFKTYLRVWPLVLIVLAFMIWRLSSSAFDGPQTYARLYDMPGFGNLRLYSENPSWRLYTFFATLPGYAGLLLWPAGLHMERQFPVYAVPWTPMALGGVAIVAVAAAQIIWGKGKRGLPLSWGLLWFGAAHFPDSGLLVPVNSLFLEHWMYLPTIGLFLGIAQSLHDLFARLKIIISLWAQPRSR